MHYFLYVGLDRFYADSNESALAVVVHDDRVVIDSCEAARARRVLPGAQLSEAKAILRGDGRFVAYREEHYTAKRDKWLDVCLLYSSGIEHETPSSAWIDLSRHTRPVEIASRLLADLWHHECRPISAAVAPAKWVSKIAARPCDTAALSLGVTDIAVIEDVASFLAALPTRLLTPVPAEHRAKLEFLGYRRIGNVQTAPAHLLRQQFGDEGMLVQEAAHGRLGDRVRPNYPRQVVECSRMFEGCCSDRQRVVLSLDEIAIELGARLRAIDMLAGATETVLEMESGVMLRRVRRLPKPSDALALSLQFQLGQMRIIEPVASVRVAVPDLRSVPLVQSALEPAARTESRRSAQASVRELRAMYGETAVQEAGKIEQPRRMQVLRAWKDATGWR